MAYDFAGKRALVTGAGKGIGRTTAKALLQCGAEVIALSRTQSDLDSLKQESPGIQTLLADVSDIKSTITLLQPFLPIHLLVNNAGVGCLQPFLEVTEEEYDRIMQINLKSILFISQAVAKDLVERGLPGSIVNVSSQASLACLSEHTVYSTSKAGLDMMSKTMGFELGSKGIRVNTVNPTVVLTAMGKMAWSDPAKAGPMLSRIPLRKFAEEEDISDAILYLLSDKSAMVNCVTLPVDGGYIVS